MISTLFTILIVVLVIYAIINLFGWWGPARSWIPAIVVAVILAVVLALVL